jgi:hypothetical protein
MTHTHLTPVSINRKTGPIPVSTTSADTCPPSCPFQGAGCYAEGGPLATHWRKVTDRARGDDWPAFCAKIAALPTGQLWRHNQAGDLPGKGNRIDLAALAALVAANRKRRGFTYTHKPMTNRNAAAVRAANDAGFTINLSANDLAHADALSETGAGPVVVVVPHDWNRRSATTPAGRPVRQCPATYRDDVTCATCGICQTMRKAVIAFPAHGARKRTVVK